MAAGWVAAVLPHALVACRRVARSRGAARERGGIARAMVVGPWRYHPAVCMREPSGRVACGVTRAGRRSYKNV